MRDEQPEYVFLAAAKVGGIHANDTYPAEFIRDNLAIQTNVIHAAWQHGVEKLLFLGSSCIYPRDCAAADARRIPAHRPAGADQRVVRHRQDRGHQDVPGLSTASTASMPSAAMPTNLYGPGDNFHPENSHVLPALIRRIHEAKLRGDRKS